LFYQAENGQLHIPHKIEGEIYSEPELITNLKISIDILLIDYVGISNYCSYSKTFISKFMSAFINNLISRILSVS